MPPDIHCIPVPACPDVLVRRSLVPNMLCERECHSEMLE